MKHLPGLAFIKGNEGKYVYVNELFEQKFKLNKNEIFGKTIFDILQSNTSNELSKMDKKVLERNTTFESVKQISFGNKINYWLINKFPITNSKNEPVLVGGIALDITEKKIAQDKVDEQNLLLDIATDAIMVCDMNDTILYWNDGAKNLYGWEETDVIRKEDH